MLKNPNYLYGDINLDIPVNINFGEYIIKRLKQYGDKTAFINAITGEELTYSDILQKSVNLAVSLSELGVRKGDTVAICSENRSEFWSSFIATACVGATFTTLNPMYTKDEFLHVTNISRPKYIFCSPITFKMQEKNIKLVKSLKNTILYGTETLLNTVSYNELVKRHINLDDFLPVDVTGQVDHIAVLYSSGTTGMPKGVILTHYNAVVSCQYFVSIDEGDSYRSLTIAPWFHAMGFWGTLGSLCTGRCLVYITKYEEKLFLESIHKYKPIATTVVPPILVQLSKSQILDNYDVSSISMIYCGAAPVDMDTISEVKKRFPNLVGVMQGYGMTETTLVVSKEDVSESIGRKTGSVGKLIPGAIVKIVDLDSRQAVGVRQRGEICFKGPLLMKGYVGKDRSDDFDEEGFFKTGDIGYYDEDGFLFIVDRLKELIKYKGNQVAPAELEAELLQHPAVRDAAVIGVRNKAAGEVPLAFIVKQPGRDVTEDELKKHIASKLSNPKHLRGGVRFVKDIPKNPSGKILRRQLRDLANSGRSKL